MRKKHSKKRNTTLVYEFLVRSVSVALVEDDSRRADKIIKIIKKHFKPNSELFKEYKLAAALHRSTVSSEYVAATIIAEAKAAVKAHDASKLMREKSLLIRDINHIINDKEFYNQHVADYKVHATIQTLFEEWRQPTVGAINTIEYEDKLVRWLVAPKTVVEAAQMSDIDPVATKLTSKIIVEKFNERYGSSLNAVQQQIIREYALSNDVNPATLQETLQGVKDQLLSILNDGRELGVKLSEVRDMVQKESVVGVNDDAIVRYMMYSDLTAELGVSNV
jgi:hypothetical protein